VSQLFGNGGGTGTPAPKLSLAVPRQKLAAVRTHRRLTATCALAGAGRCAVKATVAHGAARKLKLVKHGGSRPYVLASASGKLKHQGKLSLKLKLSAKEARALKHLTRLKLTLVATSSAAKHRSRTARRTLTLK
jgi:hypothetical protein